MSEDSERCKADIERAFHESWRLLNRYGDELTLTSFKRINAVQA